MPASDPIAKLRHDLANPLAAILAETQLLLIGDEPMPEEVRRGLQEIEKLSLRMRTILRETQAPPAA
ncbi:MAG: histidine kinase dimerization/phospho-acceptor domain-containing protein [Gemmatimonadales bacterium]|nr:histidine kinase dimerization/phospho-acceptor domain-containing protein [Gemmatimonadales bacterium]